MQRRAGVACSRAEAKSCRPCLAKGASIKKQHDVDFIAELGHVSVLEPGAGCRECPNDIMNDRGIKLMPPIALSSREAHYRHVHEASTNETGFESGRLYRPAISTVAYRIRQGNACRVALTCPGRLLPIRLDQGLKPLAFARTHPGFEPASCS